MFPRLLAAFLIVACVTLSACKKEEDKPAPTPATPPAPASTPAPVSAAGTNLEPKAEIERQLALLKAGDADALKACFTERQRDKITKEAVEAGKASMSGRKTTIDDLVASTTFDEFQGKKTCKIKTKRGSTLTTLVQEPDGRWLSDTIWFK